LPYAVFWELIGIDADTVIDGIGFINIRYYAAGATLFVTETGDRYTSFVPHLLKAAYNYKYTLKDPGGFAHNGQCII